VASRKMVLDFARGTKGPLKKLLLANQNRHSFLLQQVFPLWSLLWVIHLSYGQSKKYPRWSITSIKYIPTIRSSWSNCWSYSTNFRDWDMPISSTLTSK